jgi:hypothetical protein
MEKINGVFIPRTRKRRPVDGEDNDARVFTFCAYCCISLQSRLAYGDQLQSAPTTKVYDVVNQY